MNSPVTLLAGSGTPITASVNEASVPVVANSGGDWMPDGALMSVSVAITTLTFTSGQTYLFKIQDSPDGATWTDRSVNRSAADDGGPGGTNGGTGTITFHAVLKNPGHTRVVITLSGTSPSITLGGITIAPAFTMFAVGKVIGGAPGSVIFDLQSCASQLNEVIYSGGPGQSPPITISGLDQSKVGPIFWPGNQFFIGFGQLI